MNDTANEAIKCFNYSNIKQVLMLYQLYSKSGNIHKNVQFQHV